MSVSIKYKGNEIASMTATGTKTLKTGGKYCEGNISVENTEMSLQDEKSVSVTANGTVEVTPDEGYDGVKKVSVAVNVPSSSTPATTTLTLTLGSQYVFWEGIGENRYDQSVRNKGTYEITIPINGSVVLKSTEEEPVDDVSGVACVFTGFEHFNAGLAFGILDITGENPSITLP